MAIVMDLSLLCILLVVMVAVDKRSKDEIGVEKATKKFSFKWIKGILDLQIKTYCVIRFLAWLFHSSSTAVSDSSAFNTA